MARSEITQARLKELLSYDKESGVFTWRVATNNRITPGQPAGKVNAKGYISIKVDRKDYRAHRLAWLYETGAFPEHQVDHVNGDRRDNSWRNLRAATNSENAMNRGVCRSSKLGVKGVSLRRGKFLARIRVGGKQVRLGLFNTIEDAAAAYVQKAMSLHGEFFRHPAAAVEARERFPGGGHRDGVEKAAVARKTEGKT